MIARSFALQLGLTLATLLLLAVTPPARGRMLLVPVTPNGAVGLAALAVEHGGRLVAPGPLAGSLVVEGERGPLLAALLRQGAVPLRAEYRECGAPA
jgi:hypothetical protein